MRKYVLLKIMHVQDDIELTSGGNCMQIQLVGGNALLYAVFFSALLRICTLHIFIKFPDKVSLFLFSHSSNLLVNAKLKMLETFKKNY